jgi:RHS repeat-associated protein
MIRYQSSSFSLFAILLLTIAPVMAQIPPLPTVSGTPASQIEGAFEVTKDGAASYRIALKVPPGGGGLEPTLALRYDHRNENSMLGIGWALEGISAITRCGRTKFLDGYFDAVDFDGNDALCLDGERLQVVAGNYGQAGSVYRKTRDDFSQITAFETYGNMPRRFEVRTKDGLVLQYGANPNSSSFVQTQGQGFAWYLDRVTDPNGNYRYYTYNQLGDNEIAINSIDYSVSTAAGVTDHRHIVFDYETQPTSIKYVGGYLQKITRRVKRIVHRSWEDIYFYELSYEQTADTGLSRLSAVRFCDVASSTCTAPTTFEYSQGFQGYETPTVWLPHNTPHAPVGGPYGPDSGLSDFNGDGKSDWHWLFSYADPRLFVASNDGSSFKEELFQQSSQIPEYFYEDRFADINGDGITDRFHIEHSQFLNVDRYVTATALNNSFTSFTPWWFCGTEPQCKALLMRGGYCNGDYLPDHTVDLNGDGRADRLWGSNHHCTSLTSGWYASLSTGTSYTDASQWLTGPWVDNGNNSLYSNIASYLHDVNGDSLPDLLWHAPASEWHLLPNTGVGFDVSAQQLVSHTTIVPGYGYITSPNSDLRLEQFGDVNGDGLTDLIFVAEGRRDVWVQLSTGISFAPPAIWLAENQLAGKDPTSNKSSGFEVADFNSDGLADLRVIPDEGTQDVWIVYSNGTAFVSPQLQIADPLPNGAHPYSGALYFGDLNGDGLLDIAGKLEGSPTPDVYAAIAKGSVPNLLTKVTTGLGLEHRISWTTLAANDGTYTKGSGAQYPEVDLQASLSVVKAVEFQDGAGGWRTESYKYSGLRYGHNGQGLIGFRTTQKTDEKTGKYTLTTNRLDYPLNGLAEKSETFLANGTLIEKVEQSWNFIATVPNKSIFIFPSSVRETEYALDGTFLKWNRTQRNFDAYGNPITILTDWDSTHWEKTTNTYENNTSSWILGLLKKSVIERGAPDSATLTQTQDFFYSAGTRLIERETLEAGHPTLELTKKYTYDVWGNVTSVEVSGPAIAARTTTYAYDDKGINEISSVNPLGHKITRTFHPETGVKLSETDSNGLMVSFQYDFLGRPSLTTYPDGTQTRTLYLMANGTGPSTAVTLTREDTTGQPPKIIYYDLLNREIRVERAGPSGEPVYQDKIYNDRGEMVQESDPYYQSATPQWTTYQYDDLGRVEIVVQPGNRITKTAYAGLSLTLTNPLGQTTTRSYNPLGDLIAVKDALGNTTKYRYDSNRRLREIEDSNGNTSTTTYDLLGHRATFADPDGGFTTYEHDPLGNLKKITNGNGEVTQYTYDLLSRAVQVTSPEGTNSWKYDTAPHGVGKVAVVHGSDGYTEQYTYDDLSRPLSNAYVIDGETYIFTHEYNPLGREVGLTYPSGFKVAHEYDTLGYLKYLRNAATGALIWQMNAVDARGRVIQELFGNGLETNWSYNPTTGYLDRVTTGSVQDLGFSFNAIGNLLERRDDGRNLNELFTYDNLNRLTASQVTGQTAVTLQYDAIGNIINKSDVGSYSYGAAGPHAVTAIAGVKNSTFTYDQAGNRLDGLGLSMHYTSFGVPYRISSPTTDITFAFTPGKRHYKRIESTRGTPLAFSPLSPFGPTGGLLGRIGGVGSTLPSATPNTKAKTKVKISVNQLLEIERIGASESWDHHIFAGRERIAIFTTKPIAPFSGSSGTLRYLHRDHLGSPETITDDAGTVVSRLSFDPWGKRRTDLWEPTEATVKSLYDVGFTGHEMLDGVGLVHMGGRVYDPTLGRFLSPDPVVATPDDPQSLNRYSYVLNNPLSLTDPNGMFFKNIFKFLKKHFVQIAIATAGMYFAMGANALWSQAGFATKGFAAGVMKGAALGFGIEFRRHPGGRRLALRRT